MGQYSRYSLRLPTVFVVILVASFTIVKSTIEESLGDISPSVHDLNVQTEFLSHQGLGVTDTGLASTGALDFHEEGRGIEPPAFQNRHGFLNRLPTI